MSQTTLNSSVLPLIDVTLFDHIMLCKGHQNDLHKNNQQNKNNITFSKSPILQAA